MTTDHPRNPALQALGSLTLQNSMDEQHVTLRAGADQAAPRRRPPSRKGKGPTAGSFKRGVSGNPNGRPRRDRQRLVRVDARLLWLLLERRGEVIADVVAEKQGGTSNDTQAPEAPVGHQPDAHVSDIEDMTPLDAAACPHRDHRTDRELAAYMVAVIPCEIESVHDDHTVEMLERSKRIEQLEELQRIARRVLAGQASPMEREVWRYRVERHEQVFAGAKQVAP